MSIAPPDARKPNRPEDGPAPILHKSPPPNSPDHSASHPDFGGTAPEKAPAGELRSRAAEKSKDAPLGTDFSIAPGPAGDKNASLLESLRELNAEMLDLQDVLAKVRRGETALATFARYITKTIADVDVLVADINQLAHNPAASDTLRHILNGWEKMNATPLLASPNGEFAAQDQLHYLNMLDEEIEKIVFLCCSLTIPNRLADWLDTTRPEKYIPFHQVFEDELPNAANRQRLLNLLAWGDKAVKNGYIDLEAGLIYRFSRSRTERALSILYVVLAVGLLTGLVVGSCYLVLPGWQLAAKDLTLALSGWTALLLGVLVHIGIGGIKRTREQTGLPTQVASSDLFFIINSHFGQILLKLCMALIGFFALVFTTGIAQVTLLNCFLVGYSLDSFVEMFGSSLEKSSSAQMGAMKKQLGVE